MCQKNQSCCLFANLLTHLTQIRYQFMGPQMTEFTKLCGTYPGEWMTKLRQEKKKVDRLISTKQAPSELLFLPALREWVENRTLIFVTLLSGNSAFLMSFIYVSKTENLLFRCVPSRWWTPSDHKSELRSRKHLAIYFVIIISFNLYNNPMSYFFLFPFSDGTD